MAANTMDMKTIIKKITKYALNTTLVASVVFSSTHGMKNQQFEKENFKTTTSSSNDLKNLFGNRSVEERLKACIEKDSRDIFFVRMFIVLASMEDEKSLHQALETLSDLFEKQNYRLHMDVTLDDDAIKLGFQAHLSVNFLGKSIRSIALSHSQLSSSLIDLAARHFPSVDDILLRYDCLDNVDVSTLGKFKKLEKVCFAGYPSIKGLECLKGCPIEKMYFLRCAEFSQGMINQISELFPNCFVCFPGILQIPGIPKKSVFEQPEGKGSKDNTQGGIGKASFEEKGNVFEDSPKYIDDKQKTVSYFGMLDVFGDLLIKSNFRKGVLDKPIAFVGNILGKEGYTLIMEEYCLNAIKNCKPGYLNDPELGKCILKIELSGCHFPHFVDLIIKKHLPNVKVVRIVNLGSQDISGLGDVKGLQEVRLVNCKNIPVNQLNALCQKSPNLKIVRELNGKEELWIDNTWK
jgi:hypothetical protein